MRLVSPRAKSKITQTIEVTQENMKLQKLQGPENWAIWKFNTKITSLAKDINIEEVEREPARLTGTGDNIPTAAQMNAYKEKLKIFKRMEATAQFVITSSLSLEAVLHVINCKTSRDIWTKLQEVYESKTVTGIHMLNQQLFMMVKDEADIMIAYVSIT